MKQSFINLARKRQIIEACIAILEEVGFTNLTLSNVAKKAEISTGLISYHFDSKKDLINHTLQYLIKAQEDYICMQINDNESAVSQLEAFIGASINYIHNNYPNNIALIEIVFNERDENGVTYYRLEENEDSLRSLLKRILEKGQLEKKFTNDINIEIVCSIIFGAIEENMIGDVTKIDLITFKSDFIKHIKKLLL